MNTEVISGWDGSVTRNGYILSEKPAKQVKMTLQIIWGTENIKKIFLKHTHF